MDDTDASTRILHGELAKMSKKTKLEMTASNCCNMFDNRANTFKNGGSLEMFNLQNGFLVCRNNESFCIQ